MIKLVFKYEDCDISVEVNDETELPSVADFLKDMNDLFTNPKVENSLA